MPDTGELNRTLIYRCRVFDVYEGDVRLPPTAGSSNRAGSITGPASPSSP